MNDIFFTSDLHLGHKAVIEYSKRPFASVEEMDEALVERWNATVRHGDRVYCLGDFSFHKPTKSAELARRLVGQKFLVFGNHDKRLRKEGMFLQEWLWARDLESIKVEEQKIVLCHYALLTWPQMHRGAWQLHGHSHGSLRADMRALRLDVGVDCWNYAPVSLEVVRDCMSKRRFVPVDHHGAGADHES